MATSTTGKRRFEFSEGTSNKFWELTVQDQEVMVCFGRIGSHGQSSVKSFADAAAATKHADKLIAEKLAKGYREVT